MSVDTRKIGDIAEYKFITFCLENNIEVSKPINSGLQYDLLVKIKNEFKKVQIKSRCLTDCKITDITRWKLQTNRKKPLIDYTEGNIIDILIVYCPDTGKFYNIPLEELKKLRSMTLRVNNPKNNQTAFVRSAEDYEFNF